MPDSDAAIPQHIGYIIDGNRRWAKKHGLPTYEGHLAGYNAVKEVAFATLDAGVKFMSVYVFSSENWKRSEEEIKGLMALVLRLFTTDAKYFDENNIKLKVLGERQGLDEKIIKSINRLESRTKKNTAGTLAICLNYGGQSEIVEAVKKIIHSGAKADDVTVDLISSDLYGPEIPPLDVIVRTGGEQRLSNFMLWRATYSEFIFLKKMWPDMTKLDVAAIMKEYARRHRRFGG
jgi:undecaprenyl diphosphate synthase